MITDSTASTVGEVVTDERSLATELLLADLPPTGHNQTFVIDNEDRANWLIRKIVELRAYHERVAAWAAREQSRAFHDEEWLMRRFGPELRAWAAVQIAAFKGRRKSINLPAGTVGFRHSAARLIVDHDSDVIAWAKTNCPDAITTVEKLSRAALKEHFEQTGELPSCGAHIDPESEDFYVR